MNEEQDELFTQEEERLVGLLGEAWEMFLELPVIHGSDKEEFMRAIHAAQNIVLSRAAMKMSWNTKL